MQKLLPIACLLLIAVMPCRAETIVALYSNYRLRSFDSETPGTFTKTVDLIGIPTDETPVAMDFRSNGVLYVLTRKGASITFYLVNPDSGVATHGTTTGSNWTGTAFGFDAAPISIGAGSTVLVDDADRLQRIALNGNNASVTVAYDNTTNDGDPVDLRAGNNPAVTALAFTNNFPGAKSTVLYGIDTTPNSLVIVNYNTGQLDTVGPLGVPTGLRCSFDISGTTGTAYAALSPATGDGATLYTIDLGTGAATNVGAIGGQLQQVGVNVVGLAALPPTRLLNISTRGRVGTGEDAMIAGFTTAGGAPTRLIIRGLGPSLAAFGINSPLPNPFLSIRDASGVEIASNDDWKSTQQFDIIQSQLAPTNDLESAYIGTFAPGAYTAIVRDLNDASGIGVVEVYKLADQ
jgi:Domain of unknown function (DUF4394)